MVIHVQDASVANAAMVSSVWLPNVAHLAVSSSLCLIAHVEAPIGRHHTWICHDALVESREQVGEENMIDKEDEYRINAPKLRTPHEDDE
jgi:hypothetical protein